MEASLTLLTGGARSGKSRKAIELAGCYKNPVYIATAESLDTEMAERIRQHQQERGSHFFTLEEPVDLAGALLRMPQKTDAVVIDCLTLWINNLLFHYGELAEYLPVSDFLAALQTPRCPIFVVSNELGMGLVPADPLSRRFRDQAGLLNQQVAALAKQVILMVSGIPIIIKNSELSR